MPAPVFNPWNIITVKLKDVTITFEGSATFNTDRSILIQSKDAIATDNRTVDDIAQAIYYSYGNMIDWSAAAMAKRDFFYRMARGAMDAVCNG